VAIIRTTRINFAIPGDAVLQLQNGRIARRSVGIPYLDAGAVRVPVAVHMLDPLHRVRKVSVNLWVGDPGRERPPSSSPPSPRKTDGARTTVPLAYQPKEAIGAGMLTLPELPDGKVYWLQAVYEDARGVSRWDVATPYHAPPAVERKPASLISKPTTKERPLALHRDTTLRFSHWVEGLYEVGVKQETRWKEIQRPGAQSGELDVQRTYSGLTLDVRYNRGKPQASPLPPQLASHLSTLSSNLRLDADLRVQGEQLNPALDTKDSSTRSNLTGLHTLTQQTLDTLSIVLPGKLMQPGEKWKPSIARPIQLETFDIGVSRSGTLEWSCTYAGIRSRDGREEAVVALDGIVRDAADVQQEPLGSGSGMAIIDLDSGSVVRLEATIRLEFSANVRSFPIPARSVSHYRLEEEAR